MGPCQTGADSGRITRIRVAEVEQSLQFAGGEIMEHEGQGVEWSTVAQSC